MKTYNNEEIDLVKKFGSTLLQKTTYLYRRYNYGIINDAINYAECEKDKCGI